MSQKWKQLFPHPVYDRLFRQVRSRYERLERVGGTVRISFRDDAEREALGGLLGRDLRKQRTVTIRLQTLDDILRRSRIQLPLPEFLAAYFGERIKLHSEKASEAEERWQHFFNEIRRNIGQELEDDDSLHHHKIDAWLSGLQTDHRFPGAYLIRRLYAEDEQAAYDTLTVAIRALTQLPVWDDNMKRTPVFAAELTGDPHALDPDRPLARLVQAGLSFVLTENDREHTLRLTPNNMTEVSEDNMFDHDAQDSDERKDTQKLDTDDPSASLERRQLFYQAGLLDDDITSTVTTFGLRMRATIAHSASSYQHRSEKGEIFARDVKVISKEAEPVRETDLFVWTLRHLKREWLWETAHPLYVVENPSIFSAILDSWEAHNDEQKRRPQLVLTSGQPHMAALRLLDQWVAQNGIFYYSGDLDWKGLEMAVRLANRYPNAFRPWHMDGDTYRSHAHLRKETVPEHHQKQLLELNVPWDEQLPALIVKGGFLYQEQFVSVLIRDALNRKFNSF